MQIKELLNYLKFNSNDTRVISSVVTSTEDVCDNCVLLLTKGHNIDPVYLLNEKIKNKCLTIISDTKVEGVYYLANLKCKVFDILDYFYFKHEHNFKIIGITGTEGKSSLSKIIYNGLKNINKNVLLITNEPSEKDMFLSSLTTPDSKQIIEAMLICQKENKNYLIMEVSCIALSEKRIDEKIFDYIFLTNLESDHLDYYSNLYQYHLSKIDFLKHNTKGVKFMFSDTFNKYPNMFNQVTNLIVLDKEQIKLKRSSLNHQVFSYKNNEYYSHLIFKQNRYNLVFLIEFLEYINAYNLQYVIKKIKRVKGRLDLIHSRPYIMIDYAHSSGSVDNVLNELNSFKQNRLIIVIGAGGNRDKIKRSEYGKSCLKYGDLIYICNDNPRNEDPLSIAKMIKINDDKRFIIELNRKKAIEKAIKEASVDDIVIILGRGNENYQIINNKKIYLNDYEVCEHVLSDQ